MRMCATMHGVGAGVILRSCGLVRLLVWYGARMSNTKINIPLGWDIVGGVCVVLWTVVVVQ